MSRKWPSLPIRGVRLSLILAFAALSFLPSAALGQDAASIKSAFIYNFAKFTTWPEGAEPSNSLVVCVYGGDPYTLEILEQTVARKKIGSRWLDVKPASDAKLNSCNIAFFPSSQRDHAAAAIKKLNHACVLLIGEDDTFLTDGGMINLAVAQGKVTFEINRTATELANLHLNSQLFALARNIYVEGHADAHR